jgi:tRNA threonylcarbamoyladenosine biosynthesis protein TsaB
VNLLAIETATEACSVALWIDGEVRERFEIAPRRHTELVLPWADELLADAGVAKSQLDAIAVGRGPGAFTGVRLAIALAQGIALGLDLPVVPVSTLATLAMRALLPLPLAGEGRGEGGTHILAAIDARMGEIYVGAFARGTDGLVIPLDEERLLRPDAVSLSSSQRWIGVGTGFAANDAALVGALGEQLLGHDAAALPHAGDVARLAVRAFALGQAVSPEHAEPAYLRNNVALTLAEQQASRA